MSNGQRLTSLPTAPAPAGFQGPHSVAGEVQQFVGEVMETAMAPVNALNLAVANATLAIAQALPKFPAARLYNDLVLGWPHSHPHPPTFGVPLPSLGPVLCAGAVSVLINGLPTARVGDVGFGAWCGGYFPLFEVLTGSSHVFIGGARPARTLIDFTRHCVPGVPGLGKLGAAMMLFSAGMGALGVVESLAAQSDFEAAEETANTENEAAAMAASASAQGVGAATAAAQTAADLAAAALQAGMGKDPGAPPITCLGNFITGSPNVVIGGFPMPGWMMVLRGLAGLLRKVNRLRARRPRGCRGFDEPPPHLKDKADWQLQKMAQDPKFPLSTNAQRLHDQLNDMRYRAPSEANSIFSAYPTTRVPLDADGISANDLRALTKRTGLEHGVVVDADGNLVLIRGGPNNVFTEPGDHILVHTHPHNTPPSGSDIREANKQRTAAGGGEHTGAVVGNDGSIQHYDHSGRVENPNVTPVDPRTGQIDGIYRDPQTGEPVTIPPNLQGG